MFYNWYIDNWWMMENSSCVVDGSVKETDLERVLRTGLSLDHFPKIEDEDADEQNIGNIVSNFC